ncbi:hypothetical protein AYO40_03710 [Planctomycetaceae bacterium SCGC AG-212-D15]|nr:hypothetical protein AYO40_03710 [Planctomycetaceae bacterium SCGC AG-212-D15]
MIALTRSQELQESTASRVETDARWDWQRGFDVIAAAALLLLTAPVLLLVIALVRMTSAGPAIYRQVRVGRGGRVYTMFKIRSMRHDCEKLTGPQWSKPGDARVLPIGRILRVTHLDELPQLWNVLRGDMSLIGPRPERPEIIPALEQSVPQYRDRLSVRPGLTGLAQILLPPDVNNKSVRRKVAHDLYYIVNRDAGLDARIVLGTFLHLARVPHGLTRTLLRLPRFGAVSRAYRSGRCAVNELSSLDIALPCQSLATEGA